MAASIANQLECSICLEQYVEPKILPCFHTFCLACLCQIEPEEEKIRCPECRTEHNLPIDGAKGFKNNFIVHKLIMSLIIPEPVPSAPPLDQYVAEKVSHDDVISEVEVLSFLEDLNLTELIDIFQKEELTMKDIQGMNNADLKDIGVEKFKHRKAILSSCENLKKMVVTESPKPSSSTTKSIPQPSKSTNLDCQYCKQIIGIEVFYNTSTREYTHAPEIYGHYQLQSEMVNGRVYFKKDNYAIWWDGDGIWGIGLDSTKGSSGFYGYFINDVLCPHQITEWNGKLTHGKGPWKDAGNSLALKCSIRGNFLFSI